MTVSTEFEREENARVDVMFDDFKLRHHPCSGARP
jgi:hypothetical protein